jgi:hypothetical protein
MAAAAMGNVVATQITTETGSGDKFQIALIDIFDELSIVAVNLKTGHTWNSVETLEDVEVKREGFENVMELFKVATNFKKRTTTDAFYVCSIKSRDNSLMLEIKEKRDVNATTR